MSRIAVIGSGIAGMAAAYLLSKDVSRRHDVWLYEKDDRIGGHTHTHPIETSCGTLPIDSGFIVHNDRTYPKLIRLFGELGIEREKSDMSFAVTDRATGFEYSSHGLAGFFATKSSLVRPSHYRFLRDTLRFYREAAELLKDPANVRLTLGDYLRQAQFGPEFARYYLFPMTASVWSTSLDEVEQFPAFTLVKFFENHGWLGRNTNPQWYVLKGGSSSYIPKITALYAERIVLNAKIRGVRRNLAAQPAGGGHAESAQSEGGITLVHEDRAPEVFDEVVLACHGPQALALLEEPTEVERAVLGGFRTSRNETVMHTDGSILPRRKIARASWNYSLGTGIKAATLTYSMNRLQNLPVPEGEEYCVTLNQSALIDPAKVLHTMDYAHPLYTLDAVRSQERWGEVSGQHHTHFCGAYWLNGFHEDGMKSAVRVAKSLGVEW